jgi:hypothetical protein
MTAALLYKKPHDASGAFLFRGMWSIMPRRRRTAHKTELSIVVIPRSEATKNLGFRGKERSFASLRMTTGRGSG